MASDFFALTGKICPVMAHAVELGDIVLQLQRRGIVALPEVPLLIPSWPTHRHRQRHRDDEEVLILRAPTLEAQRAVAAALDE
eukprot:4194988-Prymnesium_polylepis.1